jgi:succinate dehydrogenase / fumarate reductase iron-sulfur subunit
MSVQKAHKVKFKIQRFDPARDKGPYLQEYIVPVVKGMTILDCLIYIKEHFDGTLAFRSSCRMAICGSCGMLVNSYPHLACHTQAEEFESDTIEIRSLPNFGIVRDLVPDTLPYLATKHRDVKPYIIRTDAAEMANPTIEYRQTPEEIDRFLQFSFCIKCCICVASCPTSASDKRFTGPQALAQCYRYSADTRDAGLEQRLGTAGGEHGLWHCHLAGACSESCPKGLDPAFGIQLLKQMMVGRNLNLSKKKQPAALVPVPTEQKPKAEFPAFTAKPGNTGK